jgi:peptide/nickel transport system substrate-binding protein
VNDSNTPYWQRWAERHRTRRGFLVGASSATLGAAALGLVGCGDDDNGTGGQTPGGGSPQAGASPAVAQIKRGGELKVSYGLEPSSLDPHDGVSGGDHIFFEDMFNFLVGHDPTGQLQAVVSLAESWEIPDPQTIVFKLRNGVTFHDGSPFNSEVVAWNIARVKDPATKSTARPSFLIVDSVETPDAQTARFKLSAPSAGFMFLLGGRGGAMLSRQGVEKYKDQFRSNPVGTGPFIFDSWASGAHMKMKKNPSYWGKDKAGGALPYLDAVTIRIIPDSTAAFAALQAGDVHMAGIDPKDLDTAKGNSQLQIIERKGAGVANLMAVNLQTEPGKNLDLRRAIMYALDPQAAKQAVWLGAADVADAGMWPPGTWVYKPSPSRPKFDLNKAKEYLAKSGFDTNTELKIMTWESRTLVQAGELWQESLRKIGIKSKITTTSVGAATKEFFEGTTHHLYPTSWSLYPEPDWIATTVYDKDAYYNTAKTQSAEVQNLIIQGRKEYDTEKRKVIYQNMAELILGQAYHVPLLYGISYTGFSKNVKNAEQIYNAEAKWNYRNLWIA